MELLGGALWLDESFDVGIEGMPGTRFVIDLNKEPLCWETYLAANQSHDDELSPSRSSTHVTSTELEGSSSNHDWESKELPQHLSVLVVDDDMIVRKLLTRSLKRVAPDWKILEASSGEAAIARVAERHFDLVFLDNYMASVDKQLLGTETAHALRAEGYTDLIICGISANDMEEAFLSAGADAFMVKPFPMNPEALGRKLLKVLYGHARPMRAASFFCNSTEAEC